jgi:hypothetical protein
MTTKPRPKVKFIQWQKSPVMVPGGGIRSLAGIGHLTLGGKPVSVEVLHEAADLLASMGIATEVAVRARIEYAIDYCPEDKIKEIFELTDGTVKVLDREGYFKQEP